MFLLWKRKPKKLDLEYHSRHTLREKGRIEKTSQIKELIFGAQDGLLGTLGIVTGLAGAFGNKHIILIAGISGSLAGAISMAAGTYLASLAERQVHLSEIEKEREEIKNNFTYEKEELLFLLMNDGLLQKDAEMVVSGLEKNKEAFTKTMIQKEFGIEPEAVGTPIKDSILVGGSYIFCAGIPLMPYMVFSGNTAIIISIGATLITLFGIGIIKGRVADMNILKSGVEMVLVGAGSGALGFALGVLLPGLLGIR